MPFESNRLLYWLVVLAKTAGRFEVSPDGSNAMHVCGGFVSSQWIDARERGDFFKARYLRLSPTWKMLIEALCKFREATQTPSSQWDRERYLAPAEVGEQPM